EVEYRHIFHSCRIAVQFVCISGTICHLLSLVNLSGAAGCDAEACMQQPVKARRKRATPSAEEKAEAGEGRLFVEALSRGFRVLEAFSQAPRPMSLAEIASISGIDKSGVQRIVHTLVQVGYLDRQQDGVALGRKLLDRSFDYLRSNPIIQQSVPVLADLRRTIQERVDLSLFDDITMHYVVRMQSKR